MRVIEAKVQPWPSFCRIVWYDPSPTERDRQVQMTRLTLVVDERELSTIQAALYLLQEQIGALPEDLAEMMSEHGPPMTEKDVGKLARRLVADQSGVALAGTAQARRRVAVELERSAGSPFSVS